VRKSLIIQLLALATVFGGIAFCVAWFIPWLPESGAVQADRVHRIYWIASIICLVIFAIVAAVLVYAVVKFRARPGDPEDGKHIHGHTMLEVVWTAIPTALVTAIAVISGIYLTKNESIAASGPTNPTGNHRIVNVVAEQFEFNFAYPEAGGQAANELVGELHVPIGQTVELSMTSKDVIHSFWVPEWSLHQDIVPGTTQRLIITPTKLGRFPIICSELCGLGHSTMRAWAFVQTPQDYAAWLAKLKRAVPGATTTGGQTTTGGATTTGEATTTAPAETAGTTTAGSADLAAGKAVFTGSAGCSGCHTLADAGSTATVGPDLDKVLAGKDEAFILTSIVDPNAVIAQGYQPNIMPGNFRETLSQDQLDALVAYLHAVANS
jgi:cytochrome c oxidase subunit 2